MLDKPSYCDHCGNVTHKDSLGDYFIEKDGGKTFSIYIFISCKICELPSLIEHVKMLPEDYQGGQELRQRINAAGSVATIQLYPPQIDISPYAPKRVKAIYIEACSIKQKSPGSFVVQIGRALEAITRDKEAEGETFKQRLDWLIDKGYLPAHLGDMGQINRIFRNWGAHDAEVDVQLEDALIVDEFFNAIVEYLYEAPAKIAKVQKLLDDRRSHPERSPYG